ncbi:MAG: EVE domain-containing protein [Patescibacteria group bacterium]
MNYWIIKSEPATYSWDNLVKDKKTFWNGVRNYMARNNLAKMKVGDLAFFYHSGDERQIVGIARIIKEAYPDPSADDPRWVMVDVEAVKPVTKPVELKLIKEIPELKNIHLVRQGRLSVSEINKKEFDVILTLAQTTL